MGIRNFYKVVTPLFPKCRFHFAHTNTTSTTNSTLSTTTSTGQYDHIALDFNNMLYSGNTLTHVEFVRHCVRQASKAVSRNLLATKTLYFALDGAAPAAKMVHQRAKRVDDADSLRRDLLFYGVRESSASSIELTPGTELMQSVADALSYSACSHLVRSATRLRAPAVAVFVDGSSVAGEGESKIFAHLHARLRENERTLIVSGDSDVVLCALLTGRKHIDVLSTNGGAAAVGYSLDALRGEVAALLQCPPGDDALLSRLIDDFCLFSILLGTDFTPPLQHYNFADTIHHYVRIRASDPSRFVYDREADSIDVDMLLRCLVAKSPASTLDETKRYLMFSELFGSLVPESVKVPPNAESFLYGVQWTLNYLSGNLADDRFFCKQFSAIAYEDIVAWAQQTNTRRTDVVKRKPRNPLLSASALIALCPLRYAGLVPVALRQLHRDVSHELDCALAATMQLPGVDVGPYTAVLDSINERVEGVAAGTLQLPSSGPASTAPARSLSFLRSVSKHGSVSHFERDETGKHFYAWPRIPRALPEVHTRTGIVHRQV